MIDETSKMNGRLDENSAQISGQTAAHGVPGSTASPHPTSQKDFGQGAITGKPSLAYDEEKYSDVSVLDNMDTLQWTEYDALPTTTQNFEAGSVYGFDPNYDNYPITPSFPSAAGFSAVSYMARKTPESMARLSIARKGTNILTPMGGDTFLRAVGYSGAATSTTRVSSIPDTVEAEMNGVVGSLQTPGSFREVRNWQRIDDLRNTIIGYFNRSIPFTDLDTPSRFAIEMCYTADQANVMLPLIAYSMIGGWYEFLDEHDVQYDNSELKLLYDPDVQDVITQIYSAVFDLPIVDEVMFERMSSLARACTCAEKSGAWPTVLMQDLMVNPCDQLRGLSFSTSRYNTTLDASVYVTSSDSVFNFATTGLPLTLHEWMSAFVNSQVSTSDRKSLLLNSLNRILGLAQSMRSNYAILLGAAMQLENKGSIKYARFKDFAPVKSLQTLYVEFIFMKPAFNYSHKERFEYAPITRRFETANGSNQTLVCLPAQLPSADVRGTSGNMVFFRPAGPYHQDKAWGIDECADIGLFKPRANSINPFFAASRTMDGVSAADTNFTASASSIPVTPYIETNREPSIWVDALYGDWYTEQLLVAHSKAIVGGDINMTLTQTMELFFHALGGVYTTPLNNLVHIGTDSTRPVIYVSSDQQPPSFTPAMVRPGLLLAITSQASDARFVSSAMQFLVNVLNQMDCTMYAFLVDPAVVGSQEMPVIVDTNYRQTQWVPFNIGLVNNLLYTASLKLVLKMQKKNVAKQFGDTNARD